MKRRVLVVAGLLILAAAAIPLVARGPVPPRMTTALADALGTHVQMRPGARRSALGAAPPPTSEALRQSSALMDRGSSRTEADDPVSLQVSKTWDAGSGNWQLALNWSGGTAPYTVSYSTDPSFQGGDHTLAMGATSSTYAVMANASATLECFAITDANGVSQSVQGIGYDPYPDLPSPTIQQDGLWWGDTVTLNGNFPDLIPQENFLGLAARDVQAASVVDGGSGFATSASFTIPDDGRGNYAFLSTHGQVPWSVPFVHLYPRGIPAYTNIRSIVYAPSTGHLWVSADGKVDEIDIFEHNPSILRSITTYAKPYLSRCTTDGRILVVDGVAGVSEIDQIDTSSGAISLYAHTTDITNTPNFTRSILPVGIAVDPDGSAAYIADATGGQYASTPVRFPQNNVSAITDNYGNWPNWYFPDPCGIEVGLTHQLYVGSADDWIGLITAPGGAPQNTSTYNNGNTTSVPASLEEDRDVSTSGYDRFFYYSQPTAMSFNQNPLASVRESSSPQYLGADFIAEATSQISVEPQWAYAIFGNAPKPVILNNAGFTYPYPTSYQVADRLVKMTVQGWQGVQIHLALMDPPDTAAYAPSGGWPAKGGYTPSPPYNVYDNDVWNDSSVTDYGLTTDPTGTLHPTQPGQPPVLALDVTPDRSNTATFYLKLPPRYAGDNWQVQVNKKDPFGNPKSRD